MIPDHKLLRLIARGSYGEVWLGSNALGVFRAIKIIFERTFRDKRPFERELAGVQRFEPVSRLHVGLMDVLQVGRNEAGGYFYYVMELADDISLGQAIEPNTYVPHTLAREVARQKRLPLENCLQMGVVIASALEFLHQHGLIHRDVKPSNIVFINGTPKLVDIGLVAEMSEARSYVGTEGFIPPEGPGTIRSDIYSLGKVLYEISTGKDRFDYPELPTLLNEPTQNPQWIQLNQVILRACRSDPRKRYQSAGEMLRDLRALQAGRPVTSHGWAYPRLRLGAQLIGIVALIAILLALSWRLRHPPRFNGAGGGSVSDAVHFLPGLVSWWRGDDEGSDALHSLTRTFLNRVTFVSGMNGRSFSFDANKGFIEVADAPYLRLDKEITIAFWIKRLQLKQADFVVEKGGDWIREELNYSVAVNGEESSYSLMFGFACGCRLAGRIADLEWHHCAIVARNGDRDPVFYIDGAPQPVFFRRGAPVIHLQPSHRPLHLGAQIDPEYNYFSPKLINCVAVYNRALSHNEVLVLASSARWDAAPVNGDLDSSQNGEPRPAGPQTKTIPAAEGLMAWWRGEGDAKDSAGTNHGVIIGNVAFVPGFVGQGFKLNGNGSYIRIPHSDSLNLSREFTIELWFQDLGKIKYNYGLIAKRGSETDSINFDVGVSPRGLTIMYNDPSVQAGEDLQSSFESSTYPEWPVPFVWHHVAATYRQAEPNLVELRTFLDGKLVKSALLAGSLAKSTNSYPVTIGADAEYPTYNYFEGIIDEVSVYNRTLSPSEIEGIFRAGKAGKVLAR